MENSLEKKPYNKNLFSSLYRASKIYTGKEKEESERLKRIMIDKAQAEAIEINEKISGKDQKEK